MDALSDVLRAVRLTGAVFFDVRACEPWVAESPAGASIVNAIFPGAEHLIPYHVVTQGTCWSSLIGHAPIHLATGDIIVFPHGNAHVMSSAPGMRGVPDPALYRPSPGRRVPFTIAVGNGSAEPTRLVCGFLGCDARPFNPLLSALPPVIRIDDRSGTTAGALARFAMAESLEPRVGSDVMLGRLSELMFVDVVRQYLASLPPERTGWLAGLRDDFVGRALTALHQNPARSWTLESLAREVGLSRSALAERFTHYVGHPPMQYLANWRMQVAAAQLRSGTDTVASIADSVGYESEAAFSRAFKKSVGVPPSRWRHDRSRAKSH